MGIFDDVPFHRIAQLPRYVFAEINAMRAKKRRAGFDVVDLGMGNPDGATPSVVVDKLTEAAQDKRNHRYSLSKGIPKLREEICNRYRANYDIKLDFETEAIATMGSKDALAHLTFATIGPGRWRGDARSLLPHSPMGRRDGRWRADRHPHALSR